MVFLVDNIVKNPCHICIINHFVSANDFPSKNLNSCSELLLRLLSSSSLLRELLFRDSIQSMNLVLLELGRKTITQSPSQTRLQHSMECLTSNPLNLLQKHSSQGQSHEFLDGILLPRSFAGPSVL